MKRILTHFILILISTGDFTMAERTEFTDDQKMHHYMGIEMNIQTWNLLGKDDRNEQDDARMVNFAKASLYHWRNSPKYQPVNEQRGQWMISRVYAVLRKGDDSLTYAEETMRLTEEHDLKDFDLAYAFEALARAYAANGNKASCLEYFQKAKEAGDLIEKVEDKKYFDSDLESGPWFECR